MPWMEKSDFIYNEKCNHGTSEWKTICSQFLYQFHSRDTHRVFTIIKNIN